MRARRMLFAALSAAGFMSWGVAAALPVCNCEVCPARENDFVWENDKFGMRAYGPDECRKWSGFDVFNKGKDAGSAVEMLHRPSACGNWHETAWKGVLDNYTMMASRGVGGIALFADGEWKACPCWEASRVIRTGDDCLEFELVYPAFSAAGKMTCHITLKRGERFFRNDVSFEKALPEGFVAGPGLDLDPKRGHKGDLFEDAKTGVVSLFEDAKGANGSTMAAIFPAPGQAFEMMTDRQNCRVVGFRTRTFSYYAGASWSLAGEITTAADWHGEVRAFRSPAGPKDAANGNAVERVVFFGDSITHGGCWEYYLQLLENLRHPGSGVRMINAGVSGDTARGGLRRFDADVLARKPDRLVVMFGMNDLYGGVGRLSSFTNDLRKILDAAAAAKVPVKLATPTPYDDWQASATKVGGAAERNNDVLTVGAEGVRALAKERNIPLTEFHRPLTEILKAHPAAGLMRPDRVHPTPAGHVVMATRAWAEAEGTAPFSEIAFAASGNRFEGAYAPKAMPLPKAEPFVSVAGLLPCVGAVNREILRVTGLAAGRYAVALDGRRIAEATADELSAGLDIAWLDTPNQRRSRQALETLDELMTVTRKERGIVALEELARERGADVRSFASVTNVLTKWIAAEKARKNQWIGYWEGQLNGGYLKDKPAQAENAARAEALYVRLAEECRPVASRLTVSAL